MFATAGLANRPAHDFGAERAEGTGAGFGAVVTEAEGAGAGVGDDVAADTDFATDG